MKRLHVQSGFTLLEMIVALTLSALVALIGALALGAGADFHARSTQRQQSGSALRAIERALRTEWESRAKSVSLTSGGIEFDTATPVASGLMPGIARVTYQCEGAPDGRFKLTSRTTPAPGASGQTVNPSDAQVKVDVWETGLTQCAFSVLQSRKDDRGRDMSAWVRSWSASDQPPQLMRAELTGDLGDLPALVFVARRELK
jgi:prepilin-type N-terminal cleavage/methylation domain-containing protein